MKRAERESSDVALARSECEARPRTLRSSGANVTSWSAPLEGAPQRAFARIEATHPARLARLERAFAGPGAPVGILAVGRAPATGTHDMAILVEFDAGRTPLGLVLAVAAAETHAWPPAISERPWPAGDTALTAFCAGLLLEPALESSRLIETYIVPMLNESK